MDIQELIRRRDGERELFRRYHTRTSIQSTKTENLFRLKNQTIARQVLRTCHYVLNV